MSKQRRRKELLSTLLENETLQPFMEQLDQDSDRARAIVASTVLDGLLEMLLRNSMLDVDVDHVFAGYGPLNSFSAKIDFCHFFGLISVSEHKELHRYREIRNEFAHSLDAKLSFTTPPVVNHLKQLLLGRSAASPDKSLNDNQAFRFGFYMLAGFLQGAIEDAKRPAHPSDPIELLTKNRANAQQSTSKATRRRSKASRTG